MKLCRIFSLLAAVALVVQSSRGNTLSRDSVPSVMVGDSVVELPLAVRYDWVPAAAGAGMLGLGFAGHYAYPRSFHVASPGGRSDHGADYLQYAPMALPWIMKIAGQPTRSGWGRMAVSQGIATALMAGTVYGLKHGVDSPRPDGTDSRSFPSGHSAWAFMGATMVAEELGWRSPWYTIGAYTLATGVAVERVVDRHHFPTDVVAGAGIGILATRLGYYFGDLLFDRQQLDMRLRAMEPNHNFSYLSLETGLSLPLGHVSLGDGRSIVRLPALMAGFRGAAAFSDHWGLALDLGLLSTPLIVDIRHDRTYIAPLHSLGAVLSPVYTYVCSNRVSLTAEGGIGYYHNFRLNAIDNAVEAGSGTMVGRINFGAIMRFSNHFSARATVGYEMSRYDFTVHPSTAYHNPAAGHTSGISSALLVNLSSRYEF